MNVLPENISIGWHIFVDIQTAIFNQLKMVWLFLVGSEHQEQ